MKLSIVTPKGKFYDDIVDYVVINGDNGQIAIMENHSPVVISVSFGFIKRVINNDEYFYMVEGAIVEYQNNVVNIIAGEINYGESLELATENFNKMRENQRLENNRKLIDFTKLERDLAKNIKEINASKL
jgi:F-type H+-transporting ATPase subunit epsilon